MRANRGKVKCGHCGGTGAIDLPAWAGETLAAIPSGGATPPQIAVALGMAPTAVNGRLAALERWGLAERARINGRSNLWAKTASGLRIAVRAKLRRPGRKGATASATAKSPKGGSGDL